MNEDYYISLIAKSLSKEISASEMEELRIWRNNSNENESLYRNFERIWDLSAEENDFEPDVELAYKRFSHSMEASEAKIIAINNPQNVFRRKAWAIIAAASILLLVGIFGYSYFSNQGAQLTTIQTANVANSLPDGSTIWMNENSKLIYDKVFSERKVTFSGEGLFDIARNPEKPFTIKCKSAQIKVLGTSFNIRSYEDEDRVVVTVVRGKVEVSDENSKDKILLVKGEKAIVNLTDGTLKKVGDDNLNALSWKNDVLKFDNETMENIAMSLSDHFDVQISVSETIKQCRFTSEFKQPDLEKILMLFENYYVINKTENGKKIEISGESCD